MNKKTAIEIISRCSKRYKENLNNQNFMFVYEVNGKLYKIQTVFFPRNYLHLTGVKLNQSSRIKSASQFFDNCRQGRLSERDFEFSPDGTTQQKLQVLDRLMEIHRNAKMVCFYDGKFRLNLSTDTLIGTTSACLGFVSDTTTSTGEEFYVPNTALNEDIRNISTKPYNKVIAVLSKGINDELYTHCRYIAKGCSIEKLNESPAILKMCNPLNKLISLF
ncbi:PBECR4 domain-containing protein [Proteiniclasticum ruminis]|uniref:Phage-Barnase-EndoU-ColicinE5/D-RelE like nuclease 4 domain-containing protein n=1 Tax=Proteiniclasticum ruminis TaxID=398199 RepID=A0A1I5EU82_9CLOT|nr:PBECR4 domain-containing protein [Proteiniclasticum ruminis]SFO15082.1 hypothetical protein SAMN04488695_12118 [Proteiniclasticum ruminis]